MTKRLYFIILALLATTFTADAQQSKQIIVTSQIRPVDPFKIANGSLFSASTAETTGRPSQMSSPESERGRIAADFTEALDIINEQYVGNRPPAVEMLTKSAITGMLRTLDPHSNFYDAGEFRGMLDEQQSEYSGIGSTIANYNRLGEIETYIVAVAPGGPADKAGLAFGDRIAAVDGEPVSGELSDVVRDKVRGTNGTIVRLTVERAAEGRTEIIEIRRNRLANPTVSDAYMLDRGVGYIDLTVGFSFTTSDEIDAALKSLKRDGMTSLVIDLRGNRGGILEQAVKVAERFLPAGSVIVTQRGRNKYDNRVWRSANKNPETVPLVLLVDQNSASASEVLAGAFQDHDRALIIGERTFGKGLVQSVLDLPFGAGLTITTARYFTPSGRSIQRDYSSGSIYDYYNKEGGQPAAVRDTLMAVTDAKRRVFGGDGIAPDEIVPARRPSAAQSRMIDPLFYFTVAAANGKIAKLKNSPIDLLAKSKDRLLNPGLIKSFTSFAEKSFGFEAVENLSAADEQFILTRLRYNLVMAARGPLAAARVIIADDPQISAAISSLPKAAQFARAAMRPRPQ